MTSAEKLAGGIDAFIDLVGRATSWLALGLALVMGSNVLLRYGFSRYVRQTPVRSGEKLAAPAVRGRDQTLPLVAARSVRVTARRGPSGRVAGDAPREVEGPIPRGRRLGTGVVPWDGEVVGRVPLLSKRAALPPAVSSLASRVDDAVPGPRAVAWVAAAAAVVAIVIGIALVLTRRRRDEGQPGQGAPQ